MVAWSGFWNVVYGDGYRLIDSNRFHRQLALAGDGYGNNPPNRIIRQLVNGNVGGQATGTYVRITGQTDGLNLGGKRTVETKTTINRATTAADITRINKDLDFKWSPTFPRDKSGNGGGGKRGY